MKSRPKRKHKSGKSRTNPTVFRNTLRRELSRRRELAEKVASARNRLAALVSTLRPLLSDEDFVALLRSEGIETMPACLRLRLEE